MVELYGVMWKLSLGEQLYQTPAGVAYFIDLQNTQQAGAQINKPITDTYESIWASL